MALSRSQLKELAAAGAGAWLEELERERQAILREFPGLGRGQREATAPNPGRSRRRRRRMTAAQRRAVSLRMKRYWAERRKKR
jgi:hypothetical protein